MPKKERELALLPKRRSNDEPGSKSISGNSKLPSLLEVRRRHAKQATPNTRHKAKEKAPTDRLSIIFIIFFFSLFFPIKFSLGSLALSADRLILVIFIIPLIAMWIRGACGKIHTVDILLLGFCVWSTISIIMVHGFTRIEFAGITFIETFGAYLMGRRFIRSSANFGTLVDFLFFMMIFLAVFAPIEAITGRRLLLQPLGGFTHYHGPDVTDMRWGMTRAMSVFEHPILFGVIMSTSFSLLYMSPDRSTGKPSGLRKAWTSIAGTFFSLSSGALLPLFIQIGLIVWDKLIQENWKWKLFAVLVVLAYVTVDLISNRTPFHVFVSYLTFNSASAYWRILIFEFGIQSVWAHPIFGIGLNDWSRPVWMHGASVDNFWLLNAMRYGIPGFILLFGTTVAWFWAIGQASISNPSAQIQKKGLLFSICALTVAVCTVHLWSASYLFFLMLLGAGMWMIDDEAASTSEGSESNGQDKSLRVPLSDRRLKAKVDK